MKKLSIPSMDLSVSILISVTVLIKEPKQNIEPKQIKPALSDPDVKRHLEEPHRKFVIVTIDKPSNNFLFICRK